MGKQVAKDLGGFESIEDACSQGVYNVLLKCCRHLLQQSRKLKSGSKTKSRNEELLALCKKAVEYIPSHSFLHKMLFVSLSYLIAKCEGKMFFWDKVPGGKTVMYFWIAVYLVP